ncbi:unnamed protein product [Brassica rapa subsp. trilocularis]
MRIVARHVFVRTEYLCKMVQRTPLWILHLVSISIFFSTGIYDKFAEAFS